MKLLADAYPTYQLKSQTAEVYAARFASIDAAHLLAAAEQHISESKFFPAISEILANVKLIDDLISGPPTPYEAWAWVQSISARGRSGEGRDSTGWELADEAVRRIGGWWALGHEDLERRHWTEKRFLEAYGEVLDGHTTEQRLVPAMRQLVQREEPQQIGGVIGGLLQRIGRRTP